MTDPATTNGPKLRTACDNCQLSKVRCSRGKPSCWRCSQSGVKCVYSPLRRTGRPPKGGDRDRNAATQREKAPSNRSHNRSSQEASPDRTPRRRHSPPQDVTDNDMPATCSQPASGLAASSAAMPALDSIDNAVSQEMTENPALTMANIHMGVDASDFSLDMDLDLGMGLDTSMWTIPTISELATMDPSPGDSGDSGDIGATAMSSSETAEIGHLALDSVLSPPFTCDCDTYRGRNKPPKMTAMPTSSVSEDTSQASLAPSTPTTAFSSLHAAPASASVRSVRPGPHKPVGNKPCPQDGSCYQILSGLLTKLGDFDLLSQAESTQLDGLLCLDRELQHKVRMALGCSYCTEMPSNQNLLMIIYMSVDSLLSLFEKQQRQRKDRSAATASRRHLMAPSRFSLEKSDDASSNINSQRQFPWTEQPLVVGSFPVDDVVKASFLQRLVLEYIENVLSLLGELEKMADTIMKGVNGIIYRHKADDIYKRAYFLRARLLLATDDSGLRSQ